MAEKVTAAPWELPYPASAGEVKLGAADMQELAERATTLFKEHTLIVKAYAAGATLKSGELAIQEKAGETFTLPAVGTANQVIGVFNAIAGTPIKVTTAANIWGDFVTGVATIQLAYLQHVVLQSDGARWLIVAGEPKREQTYTHTEPIKAIYEATGVEPSATRLAHVIVNVNELAEHITNVSVGGVTLNITGTTAAFMVPPGQKWRVIAGGATIQVGTLLL